MIVPHFKGFSSVHSRDLDICLYSDLCKERIVWWIPTALPNHSSKAETAVHDTVLAALDYPIGSRLTFGGTPSNGTAACCQFLPYLATLT